MGPAAIGIGIGSTLLGAFTANKQRKAIEAQTKALSQPTTTTTTPYGPTQSLIDQILGSAGDNRNTPLPLFPEFEGTDFSSYLSQFAAPGVNFNVPNIPGTSKDTRGILQQILALTQEDPFVGQSEGVLERIFAGPTDEAVRAQGNLLTGPLAGIAQGNDLVDPFENAVASGLRREADRALEQDLARISSAESSVGQTPSPEGGTLGRQARRDNREALFDSLARGRSANFQSASNRQVAAGQSVAGGLGNLAGLRSNEILSALGIIPSLESARFLGPTAAGGLSTNIDQLNQSAAAAEGQLGLGKAGLELQAALGGDANQLRLLGLQSDENRFRAGFDLDRFNFDLQAPFLRDEQLMRLILPLASQFGTTTTQGPQVPPGYSPNAFEGGLTGLLGGLGIAGGLGLFGGGGSEGSLASLFQPYGVPNFGRG